MTESELQSHVTLIHLMIAAHSFQFQNKTFSSFLDLSVLMDECHPQYEV